MIGYGSEGKPATGYRGRLYARAMVLEDRRGERLAIVALDVGMASVLMHRRVAALTLRSRIGADRLLLAGTHTHAGPGNFFGVPGIDGFASTRSGFDARLTGFVVERIARAVNAAADSMAAAPPVAGAASNAVVRTVITLMGSFDFTVARALPA